MSISAKNVVLMNYAIETDIHIAKIIIVSFAIFRIESQVVYPSIIPSGT